MSKPIIWVSEDALFGDKPCEPGSAYWDRDDAGKVVAIEYVCPCGCGEFRRLGVSTPDKIGGHWQWDGNETSPTLKPSIQHVAHKPGDCSWHGFLTAGKWVKA